MNPRERAALRAHGKHRVSKTIALYVMRSMQLPLQLSKFQQSKQQLQPRPTSGGSVYTRSAANPEESPKHQTTISFGSPTLHEFSQYDVSTPPAQQSSQVSLHSCAWLLLFLFSRGPHHSRCKLHIRPKQATDEQLLDQVCYSVGLLLHLESMCIFHR